jgi:salicylate hydroxylase
VDLPDGPEARARNARMAAQAAENGFGPLAATWAVDPLDRPGPSVAFMPEAQSRPARPS